MLLTTSTRKRSKRYISRVLSTLFRWLRKKEKQEVLEINPVWHTEWCGEPGEKKLDEPIFWENFRKVMDPLGIQWCVTGDHLLVYYNVPKGALDFEICIRDENMSLVTEAFDKADFCKRAPSTVGHWKSELKDCPRFKVIGEHPGFIFCPATTTQGSLSLEEDDLVATAVTNLPYPVPTLPSYIMSATNGRGSNGGKGISIIGFLVHGVDIDTEWCQKYLVSCEEKWRKLVEFYASSEQKRREMLHPKCRGYITSYIADEEQLKFARSIPGRDPTYYISTPSNERDIAIPAREDP